MSSAILLFLLISRLRSAKPARQEWGGRAINVGGRTAGAAFPAGMRSASKFVFLTLYYCVSKLWLLKPVHWEEHRVHLVDLNLGDPTQVALMYHTYMLKLYLPVNILIKPFYV